MKFMLRLFDPNETSRPRIIPDDLIDTNENVIETKIPI